MNNKFIVNLNMVNNIKSFVEDMTTFESDVYAIRGRYSLDAKSIMGLLSIDLSIPLDVKIEVLETYQGLKTNDVYITDIGFGAVSSINGAR